MEKTNIIFHSVIIFVSIKAELLRMAAQATGSDENA